MKRAVLLVPCLVFGLTATSVAQNEDARERRRAQWRGETSDGGGGGTAVHGGQTATTETHQFEVVLTDKEIRIYLYDASGTPVSAKKLGGKVGIGVVRRQERGGHMRRAEHVGTQAKLAYRGASKSKGRLRDCLRATHKLGEGERQHMRLDVTITNLRGAADGKAEFRVTFAGVSPKVEFTCPTGHEKAIAYQDPGKCPKCEEELKQAGVALGGQKNTRDAREERAARRAARKR